MSGESKAATVRIIGVRPVRGHTLLLRWASGKELPVDLREPIFRLKGLRTLRDRTVKATTRRSPSGR